MSLYTKLRSFGISRQQYYYYQLSILLLSILRSFNRKQLDDLRSWDRLKEEQLIVQPLGNECIQTLESRRLTNVSVSWVFYTG